MSRARGTTRWSWAGGLRVEAVVLKPEKLAKLTEEGDPLAFMVKRALRGFRLAGVGAEGHPTHGTVAPSGTA